MSPTELHFIFNTENMLHQILHLQTWFISIEALGSTYRK